MLLIIAVEEPGRKPLSVACVRDAQLLQRAAAAALKEAAAEVEAATKENPILGKLRAAELVRLQTVLEHLIPARTITM